MEITINTEQPKGKSTLEKIIDQHENPTRKPENIRKNVVDHLSNIILPNQPEPAYTKATIL